MEESEQAAPERTPPDRANSGAAYSGDTVLPFDEFVRRTVLATGVVALALGLFSLMFFGHDFVLVGFAAVLVGVFLDALATPLADRLGIGRRTAVWFVTGALLAALGVSGWLLGPQLWAEAAQGLNDIPTMIDMLRSALKQRLPEELSFDPEVLLPGEAAVKGVLESTLGTAWWLVTATGLVLVLGFFMALFPANHYEAALSFVPHSKRRLIRKVGNRLRWELGRWLLVRALAMLVVGVAMSLGLYLIGVPYPLALGSLAGALAFIPYLGPLLGLAPILAVAAANSLPLAGWALVVYLVVQGLESNFLTPVLESQAVQLPAGLLLLAQFGLGYAVGALGLLLSTPTVVVAAAFVRRIVLEELLQDGGADSSGVLAAVRGRVADHDRDQTGAGHPTDDL